jgi:predicted PurR-regulated permease PerM
MDMRRLKIHNTLIILVFITFIVAVGVWGDWFGPLELATCTARGGQIVGDYGSGDV